jgi:hypothetical protein
MSANVMLMKMHGRRRLRRLLRLLVGPVPTVRPEPQFGM